MFVPIRKVLYKVDNSSLYVRVLSIFHVSETKIVAKLQFEYKNGLVIERPKSYRLKPKLIQHWKRVTQE